MGVKGYFKGTAGAAKNKQVKADTKNFQPSVAKKKILLSLIAPHSVRLFAQNQPSRNKFSKYATIVSTQC